MFRNHLGGRNAARQAVFALLPVVIGAGVLLATGDGPAPARLRLEATQTSVTPWIEPPAPVVVVGGIEPATHAGVKAEADAVPVPVPPPDAAGAEALAGLASDAGIAAPVDGAEAAAPAAETGAGGGGAAGASPVVTGGDAGPASAGSPGAGVPATSAPSTSSSTSSTTTTTSTMPPAPSNGARRAGVEAEVVPLTNADRSAAGLGTLSRNGCLDAAASGFAEKMARNGALAHNPGAGSAATGCRAGATWGDNVGMSTACDTAFLQREWMASPSHRRNILNGAFTSIGVGAWTDGEGTCWVQVLFSS